MKHRVNNVVVISDMHSGCRFALCPPKVKLDKGGNYEASDVQLILHEWWKQWWDKIVPILTKKEEYYIVINGDLVDGEHHGSKTQISHNLVDQTNVCKKLLEPILRRTACKGLFIVRGTEAHSGKSAEQEEEIAQDLNSIKDEFGDHSYYELWLQLGRFKSLLHFSHHVGTTSSASYESTAVYKELVEAYNEAGRFKNTPPDAIIRSHRHRQFQIDVASGMDDEQTLTGRALSIVTPAWQLKTPFAFKGVMGRSSTPQIGGYVIRSGDEDPLYARYKVWRVRRSKTIKI